MNEYEKECYAAALKNWFGDVAAEELVHLFLRGWGEIPAITYVDPKAKDRLEDFAAGSDAKREYLVKLKSSIARHDKRYQRLLLFKERIEVMSGCHVVEYPIVGVEKDILQFSVATKELICHGLDAAGDLSGGFAMIKQGLMKECNFELYCVRDELKKRGVDVRCECGGSVSDCKECADELGDEVVV